ncbi:MAG: HAMP domain-containing protein [Chloroflexi bacterium]|nr:HAMP domain-containing protein [Chloroflexota bacterium]
MSIRLRLTLWYVLVLAVILVAFSGALYAILSFSLLGEVDRTLERRAGEVQTAADAALQVQSDLRLLRTRFVLPGADVFATPGVFVQVVSFDGTVVSRSENLGDKVIQVSQAVLDRVKEGESVYVQLTSGGALLRVYVRPLTVRSQNIGAIEVAQSLQDTYATLRRLAVVIVAGIGGALLLAFVIGALLAYSALAPIDRMTQAARDIARKGDLTQRIEHKATGDELGRLAATFNEMLTRIEELFRVQQRFVADVSHELRSPLTAIRGNLDLLKRGAMEDPDERQTALDAMESESARMQRLVQDLLLLAQADAGVKVRKDVVELDTLLLDVYGQARLTQSGVKVSLGNEDQAQVLGDADRLKQLLLNLVDNAIKYTPSGGEVKLSLERDSDWVRVAIADTGVGIPAQDVSRIFDRFYRVDKARSRDPSARSGGGTGLGLAICKWIAEVHGGRIEVQSEVGKGSTFTVWLPVASR